jgi:hypothetical protein
MGYEGVGSEHDCPSTLLLAAAHWQRYLFKDTLPAIERRELLSLETAVRATAGSAAASAVTPGVAEQPEDSASQRHRRLNVVWLSRSWFSRGLKAGGGLTGWQASRDMPAERESELAGRLEQAVLKWNDHACVQPVFGWWQMPHDKPQQHTCKPSNVSFDFRVSALIGGCLCDLPFAASFDVAFMCLGLCGYLSHSSMHDSHLW